MRDRVKNFLTDGIGSVVDFFILNVCFIITCLPILTIGTSCSAMFYVIFHIFDEQDAHLTRQYFKAWKENFVNSSSVWLAALFCYFICYMAFYGISQLASGTIVAVLLALLLLIVYLCSVFLIYFLSLQARFINSILATVKNALILSFGNPGKSFTCFLIVFFPVILALLIPGIVYGILGFMILFGFSLQFYLISKKLYDIYQELENDTNE